jgi:glycosyltransferase involved in cell wall biosynthesis
VRVAQIGFFWDSEDRSPERLMQDWSTMVDVAECADGAGADVTVIQASRHRRYLSRNRVNYHFLPFGAGARLAPAPGDLARLLQRIDPDVVHVHGLHFPADVLALSKSTMRTPIILQDHASGLPRFWRRPLWRRAFAAAAGVAFCSRAQALPFARAHLMSATTPVYEIPESSSRFTPGDRAEARRSLGVQGSPLVLWVGHLDANKDPLTVLDAVSLAARTLPDLQLYCCYGAAPLLGAVQRRIARDPHLHGRVHLLGTVSHQCIEQLMRAADVFVLASHREGSGYALIEALACGLPPLVTDIASFRTLTGDGRIGSLWPTGNAPQLSKRLVAAATWPQSPTREATRAHFDRELSFAAVGRKLARAYLDVVKRTPRGSALV